MAKKFEVFRKGNDPGRDIARYGTAVAELVERLPVGKAYEFKRRGADEWRSRYSKPKLKAALMDQSLKVGEAIYARRAGGRAVFVLRAIEVFPQAPAYPDPQGTPGIKRAWDAAWDAFRKLGPGYEFVYMGAFVCRRIDGSSLWSNHAFHNAFDFRIRRANAPSDSIDVAATTKVVYATRTKVAESIWQSSGHYYHAHLTGQPKQFGTPGCAR